MPDITSFAGVSASPLTEAQVYADGLALPAGGSVREVKDIEGDLSVISLDVPGASLDDPARDLVDTLRSDRPEFDTWVVGQASGLRDFTDSMLERAPYAFALVALATLVLLFLMTGSVVIPVKALLLNGAAA